MAGVIIIREMVGTSPRSWSDAARQAVATASKTVRNIRTVEVVKSSAAVEDGQIVEYRASHTMIALHNVQAFLCRHGLYRLMGVAQRLVKWSVIIDSRFKYLLLAIENVHLTKLNRLSEVERPALGINENRTKGCDPSRRVVWVIPSRTSGG